MGVAKGRLPSEYQEVEYLQNSATSQGDTAFIRTMLSFNNSNVFGEIEISFFEAYSGYNHQLYGGLLGWGADEINCRCENNKFTFSGFTPSSITNTSFTEDILLVHKLNEVWENGELVAQRNTPITSIVIPYFHLFSFGYGNSNPYSFCNAKVRYAIIKNAEGTILRNYVPCTRKIDSKPGMYDLCGSICPLTETPFYVSAGVGEFIAGDPV